MSRLPKSFCCEVILLTATFSCILPLRADDKPADKYTETGTVLSAASKHGHFYQVSTDSRIYLLLCDKVKSFQLGQPECKVGDKPIATGVSIHFRVEGDWAYMPPVSEGKSEGMEEKLRILTTELKVIPPLPPAAATPTGQPSTPGTASNPSNERGIVIGSGLHVKGQHGVGWSTNPAAGVPITTVSGTVPVMATAPVTAIPVTGGAPVMVMPNGPTTGGVVTGVPVTGGAPITAIPTAPVMGVPVGGAPAGGGMVMMGGGAPQWVHVLRIQTGGKVYQLECSTKPCMLAKKEIALGDTLALRVDKKHAYLSSDLPSNPPSPGGEQEYKILSVTDVGSTVESKPE